VLAILRQRNFALLWFGGLISLMGDWLLRIGLPVYVYTLTGSALATSIMLITGFVPDVLLGSVAGVFVDRWDRRKTMLISNLLLAFGLLPLLAVHSKDTLWLVYIIQFFEGCVSQFVLPAESALIPHLVSEEQLVSANALKSIGQNISRLVGSALGGLLIGDLGLSSVVLLDAVTFLFVCGMLGLMRLPVVKVEHTSVHVVNDEKNLLREWLEGLQLIFRVRPLTILFLMFAVQSIGEGVFSVLLVVFVEKVLGYGAAVYGSLGSMQAVGSLLGGAIIGLLGKRYAPARLVGLCICLFGIIDLLIINVPLFIPNLLIIWALFILVGIPGIGAMVGVYSLFQSLVADELRGRVFGAFITIEALMVLIGMSLAGLLGDRLGASLMLNIQGSVYTLSGLLGLLTLGRMMKQQEKQEKQDTELIVKA
jgi:MFS family permease